MVHYYVSCIEDLVSFYPLRKCIVYILVNISPAKSVRFKYSSVMLISEVVMEHTCLSISTRLIIVYYFITNGVAQTTEK